MAHFYASFHGKPARHFAGSCAQWRWPSNAGNFCGEIVDRARQGFKRDASNFRTGASEADTAVSKLLRPVKLNYDVAMALHFRRQGGRGVVPLLCRQIGTAEPGKYGRRKARL